MNLYWRRFRLADIPLDNAEKFNIWIREEWYKKDALLEEYVSTGRFPAMAGAKIDYVEAEVKTRKPWEILEIFTVVAAVALMWHNAMKAWSAMLAFLGM